MSMIVVRYSTQFDLPGVGATSITDGGTVTLDIDALLADIDTLSGGVDVSNDVEAMFYSVSIRSGLDRVTGRQLYAIRDGAGWRVDLPTAGVWFTCDYLMTYASAVLDTYDAVPGRVTEFVSTNATTPPFWKELVGTLEDGAGSVAASGSWTP